MGTNFYLRRKEPRIVYDEYHIAKTSGGWRPSFEAYTPWDYDYDRRPQVHSVEDIKDLANNGDFTIVDEYGDEYTWDEFVERVLKHCPEGQSHYPGKSYRVYKDKDGYEFNDFEYQ